MGALTSRQHAGVEEVDVISNHAYKYPPRSGNYFGSHFIMGGERFDTPQPESYLFGENSDLNFLGSRPTPFPYPPPQPNEPTKTLKSLVNIRKESLRFVRATIDYCKPVKLDKPSLDLNNSSNRMVDNNRIVDIELGKNSTFNIEFTFDCDVRCSITIYYFCTEEFNSNGVTYIPRDPSMTSETFHYKRGANQQFCQMTHTFDPSKYPDDELLYDVDREMIPIAIHCVAEEGNEDMRQSHTTIATAEKLADGTYILKALKQKLFVDGLCYLLQEIYGIENKNNDKQSGDDDTEDNGSECVICMCEVRDTLILPCRHLCLCNSCADSLRYQANNCPICRAPFRALLQIRALQKSQNNSINNSSLAQINQPTDGSCDNIPPGYEAISLIEALNGPCITTRQPPSAAMPDLVETPDSEHAIQAAQILNRNIDQRNTTPMKNGGSGNNNGNKSDPSTPEYGVLMTSREDDSKETTKCPLLAEQKQSNSSSRNNIGGGNNNNNSNSVNGNNKHHRATRDSIKHINEKTEKDENIDEDSEAEKLSPLLQNRTNTTTSTNNTNLALNMVDVVEPIDDTDNDEHDEITLSKNLQEKNKNYREERGGGGGGDESDYYTPEEPTSNLGPLYDNNVTTTTTTTTSSSVESTPQRLPGTPVSHASARSSGDSFTSGSSTRHLLAVVTNNGSNERGAVHI